MHYEMKLLIANNKMNDFMKGVDLKPENKVYVQGCHRVTFTAKEVKENMFYKIIDTFKKKSNETGFWVPAIYFCGKIYVDKGIKQISDGKRNLFVQS